MDILHIFTNLFAINFTLKYPINAPNIGKLCINRHEQLLNTNNIIKRESTYKLKNVVHELDLRLFEPIKSPQKIAKNVIKDGAEVLFSFRRDGI